LPSVFEKINKKIASNQSFARFLHSWIPDFADLGGNIPILNILGLFWGKNVQNRYIAPVFSREFGETHFWVTFWAKLELKVPQKWVSTEKVPQKWVSTEKGNQIAVSAKKFWVYNINYG
jgi:hypothetical protein